MILRTLFLVGTLMISPSLGKLDPQTFSEKFEENCFQNSENEPFLVNGQETPLSNSLENFIAMAEKFEVANPSMDLKRELAYFISGYVFENLEITNGRINQWDIKRASLKYIEPMWDPDMKEDRGYEPTDPFIENKDESCSLYYMISHSIMKKDTELLKSYSPRNLNYSSRSSVDTIKIPDDFYPVPLPLNLNVTSSRSNTNLKSTEIHPNDYFPQELGVVSIRGTDAAVSLNKVLIGLYVGLNSVPKSDLNSYDPIKKVPEDLLPQDKQVDPVYITTLAEVLMQSQWAANARNGLAPNGQWVSIPLSPDKLISGFCPMVYKQQIASEASILPVQSYSSVRGAADGLILGLTVPLVYARKQTIKLSQILRMYYSPDGITVDSPIEDINEKQVSFCRREALMQSVYNKLMDQMKCYGFLVADTYKLVPDIFDDAKKSYDMERGKIFYNLNTEIQEYCSRSYAPEKPEDLPRETFLDVLVVMDTSNSKDAFQEQQLIAGHLAKQLDLRYTGSRMTILLDQRVGSGTSSSSKIELKPVVSDTYSSSCAACTIGQIDYEHSTDDRDKIIAAIDQYLQERKQNETDKSGANGKVVVYFNYENVERNNNKIQGSLQKALSDLHLRHLDITFLAVGLDSELLRKYAKGDPNLVFLGSDGLPETVAKNIFTKISNAPALLQYSDCKDARNEGTAIYENFVSPLTIQHYEMPAEYFYKSYKLTVNFKSQNGYVKVCHNRATKKPEEEDRFCNITTTNGGVEFTFTNPCKNFNEKTCSNFYFSIMGMESNGQEMRAENKPRNLCDDINNNHWCSNLNQIKYTVSHQGVRCSGCLRLNAPPTIVLFAILLSYFIHKRF